MRRFVADHLGLPLDKFRMVQGDTARIATGGGTGGSSSIPAGGVSVSMSAKKLAQNLKDIAADALEASPRDLEFEDGKVKVAGTDRAISFADLAKRPEATDEKLTSADAFTPPAPTYPNGTHLVEIEIDEATGATEIVNYVIVDDFGVTLNPLMLAGQVHGGTVQGIGQALMEETVYDGDSGQLVTASLMDYALPRASHTPDFSFETRNVPCKNNPMGFKGAGEAGAIGSCPGDHECDPRRLVAGLQHPPSRHAGDRAAHLGRDRGRQAHFAHVSCGLAPHPTLLVTSM